jgi:hypothetical protein
MFKMKKIDTSMILLSAPSYVKSSKKYYTPYSREKAYTLNWYNLTDKGKQVIEDLMANLKWNKKEMNMYLFKI